MRYGNIFWRSDFEIVSLDWKFINAKRRSNVAALFVILTFILSGALPMRLRIVIEKKTVSKFGVGMAFAVI
mgnify:CR=1 FL=1